MATAPAIMEVDSVFGREAIEPDLSSYARQWRFLLQKEVEAPYGPIQPEPDDIQELRRKGTWIPDVTLHARVDCIEARWTENVGHNIVQGTDVVISRTHPKVDKLRTCTVTARTHRRLLLRAWSPDPDIEMGTWRLDVEVNWVPYYRVNTALHHFTSLSPPSPPSILQVLIGSCVGNSQQRRALNEVTGGALGADMSALLPLNDSQRNAVQRSLAQRVLLIQGPPGTGKTQVAEAIFRVWKSKNLQGPAVGATPSNVAADNLASRLLRTGIFDALRYGPTDKINDVAVRRISSQAMAVRQWSSTSPKARKWRKQWENEQFVKQDVVIGTLEMAADLCNEQCPWTTPLILVDEAGQATEPMTVIPFQLARRDTRVVLIGDHMQLAPTVLDPNAAFNGLAISIFERLWRVPGLDPCTLTLQYRMHESICSWPSLEFLSLIHI